MTDQPVPDHVNPAPNDVVQDPSPPKIQPSFVQSLQDAMTPQSDVSALSSLALIDLDNTTSSIDCTKDNNEAQDNILSDILKAAAASPNLLELPVFTGDMLMGQALVPAPPVVSSTADSTLPTTVGSQLGMLGSTSGQSEIATSIASSEVGGSSPSTSDRNPTGTSVATAAENLFSNTAVKASGQHMSRTVSLQWQELLANMLSDLGLVETSRMMAAEELVLTLTHLGRAPEIIANYVRQLQKSITSSVSELDAEQMSGSSKRVNVSSGSGSMDIEGQESVKRRRVGNDGHLAEMDATRNEIEEKMAQFMALKREQINESNRQEFIKGRHAVNTEDHQPADDGCARVDARKLNRTIQMKLETVKNDALSKTNPKNVVRPSDAGDTNGMDERLRNIQAHLNLRFAATPVCTLAERVRIIEDVIIQLERDYPPWSALHFNQPNRTFPPPPPVTTVSRNAKNQIIMTGDHLATTLIENGDPLADSAPPGSVPHINYGTSQSGLSAGAIAQIASRTGSTVARTMSSTETKPATEGVSTAAAPGAGRVAPVPAPATGSATVIKLKRHGGAGSSSLARAVQQQLAQRKAAAGGLLSADESKAAPFTPSFKITPSHYGEHNAIGSAQSVEKSVAGAFQMSSPGSSPGTSSLSPTMGFPDPSKPGVTGRGPIKSRRKSIAKGLDPTSTLASMSIAHAGGGGHILGSNSGSLLPGSGNSLGSPVVKGNFQANVVGQSPAGSLASTSKSKTTSSAKKPRKKKGDDASAKVLAAATALSTTTSIAHEISGRSKGGYGLGKGKSGRPLAMGLGLGKGKGGAYREEILRRAEVEDFDDGSDEDMDEDDFQETLPSGAGGRLTATAHIPNPLAAPGAHVRNMTLANANRMNMAPASAVTSSDAASQQQQQQYQAPKSKKKPQKPSTPAKPPAIRKFGGKSFGMAGGESSDSNESSDDGDGSGSSGSQTDTSSSSSSGSDSDPGDSD
ncbi:hypothetical protein BG004_006516 [Podila humilis]|nr:hypothetical protein BG004_006516 [Podila humilis]